MATYSPTAPLTGFSVGGTGRTTATTTRGGEELGSAIAEPGTGRTISVRSWGGDGLLPPAVGYSVKVPTGSFRRVHVELYDTDGEPLTEATRVQSAGVFPTAALVDSNGEANMWLLNTTYDRFVALAEGDRPGVGYVWYTVETESEVIDTDTTDARLVFEKKEITGFDAGNGVDFGGNLNA